MQAPASSGGGGGGSAWMGSVGLSTGFSIFFYFSD
jgi:hypothetical protein